MNERIQELMEQADLQPYYNAQEAAIKKFAELLIQRCGELSDLAEDNDLHGSTIIKRHFGVEE